jgi:hypothetical protein
MIGIRVATLAACLSLFPILPATALAQRQRPPTGFAEARGELDAQLVPVLAGLARECRDVRLYGDGDRLHAQILVLDPEHAEARRALRYHRVGGGRWVQSRGWKPRRNHARRELEPVRQRVAEELEGYRNALFMLIDLHRPELGLAGVELELQRLLALLPEDESVRGAVGEVRVEGEWILVESWTARKHRAALPPLAKACLAQAPAPEDAAVRPEERQLGIPWNAARRTRAVRVLGTTGVGEAGNTARVTHAVGDFFRNVFAVERRHRDDLTIYLLDHGHGLALLQRWPRLSEETRRGLAAAVGGWLDSPNRLAEWSPNPDRRLDGAARQTLGTLLMDAFGIDGRCGWAWEGVGLYLIHDLVGTRLTWFFDTSGYRPQTATGLWTRLQDPTVDWFAEARSLLEGENPPRLTYLLGRDINAMREEDVLFAYVLAAYLLEGHPRRTPEILRRIGAGEHPVAVFEEELGHSLPVVEERLRRWLAESRPAGD